MKRYLLGIAALIMAIGFTAFTTKKADTSGKSHFQTPTWVLIDQGQASDATYRSTKTNYTSVTDFSCTSSNVQVCKVILAGDGNSPARPNFADGGPNDDVHDALFANTALLGKVFIKP